MGIEKKGNLRPNASSCIADTAGCYPASWTPSHARSETTSADTRLGPGPQARPPPHSGAQRGFLRGRGRRQRVLVPVPAPPSSPSPSSSSPPLGSAQAPQQRAPWRGFSSRVSLARLLVVLGLVRAQAPEVGSRRTPPHSPAGSVTPRPSSRRSIPSRCLGQGT